MAAGKKFRTHLGMLREQLDRFVYVIRPVVREGVRKISLLLAHRSSRRFDRVNDVLTAGTATNITLEHLADLLAGGVGSLLEDAEVVSIMLGCSNHTVSRVPPEILLDRVKLLADGEPSNRRDLAAVDLHWTLYTIDRVAAKVDNTDATEPALTAHVRHGVPRLVAETVDEESVRFDGQFMRGSVVGEFDVVFHALIGWNEQWLARGSMSDVLEASSHRNLLQRPEPRTTPLLRLAIFPGIRNTKRR